MKKKMRSCQNGVTLIELVIVMGMLGFIMAAIYSLFVTHQRTAYTEEEVVDVQQNLRIAMDRISRDIRMAGMLVPKDVENFPNPSGAYNNNVPVGFYQDGGTCVACPMQPLEAPDNVKSDTLTLNMASAESIYAIVTSEVSAAVTPGTDIMLPVDNSDYFSVGQEVRIFDSANFTEPNGLSVIYTVEGTYNNAAGCGALPFPCLKLRPTGGTGATTLFPPGFAIARTRAAAPIPNTVRYALVQGATCPTGPLCLERITDEGTMAVDTQVIATNLAGLQFSYFLDDGTESFVPPDLEQIRAVRVTIIGQTADTVQLSGDQAKRRQVTSVVKIRNRYNK